MTAVPDRQFTLSATVLGAPDPRALAAFYRDLLGFTTLSADDGWVMLANPAGGAGLSFQLEEDHVRPVWPAKGDDPQMQFHLDIEVDDLESGVARAVALGAQQATFQPQEHVRVLVDPAGHPFCLFVEE
jgi:catechol 2,3-dioxygenase-like lactoylglutathione lyase family enzyme